MIIYCHECNFERDDSQIEVEQNEISNGVWEFGWHCPRCQVWTHAQWLNTTLLKQKQLLAKFANKANQSDKAFQRYRRKKAEYARNFTAFQEKMRAAVM